MAKKLVCTKKEKQKFEKEVTWFSKMYGIPKQEVKRKLKKDGFICN